MKARRAMIAEKLEKLIDEAARANGRPDAELNDSYRGALLGLAAGNALGVPVEGWPRRAIRERFPQGVAEIDPAEAGRPWDDDTAQAVVLSEAILETRELDLHDLGRRLVRWASENGRGIGNQTRRVITQLAAGASAEEAARSVWEQSGRNAAGNGAVMRSAPVALRWRTSGARLVAESLKSAIVTHYDPRCQWSVVAFNSALALVLSGAEPDLASLASLVEEAGGPREVADGIRDADGCRLEQLELDGPAMGYTIKAMQVGLWALQQRDNFEGALASAIEAGGDTDTNGAVAGAMLGARFGASRIPERWTKRLRDPARLASLADALWRASTEGDRP
jgi:ADP-ribosyl-[dinitrogen reductase] hydrolase